MKNLIFRKSKQLLDYLAKLAWRKFLLTLIFIILVATLTNFVLEQISSRDFLTILPALKITTFLLIALGSIIFFFRKELNVENHQGLINCLLIVITIAFTFSVYFIDRQNSFYNTNTVLVRANEINVEIAEAIILKDYSKGYPFIFFLTWPYEQNLSFISKNFISGDCVTSYYRAMMEMRIVNDITSSIIMHAVEESSVREIITNKASSTTDLIKKISKDCHLPDTSHLN